MIQTWAPKVPKQVTESVTIPVQGIEHIDITKPVEEERPKSKHSSVVNTHVQPIVHQ